MTLSVTLIQAEGLPEIEEKGYATALKPKGIPAEHIKMYGFAFEGKMC